MPKIVCVTDSTAYLPNDLVEEYGIAVAPQILVWGDNTYHDGVDIQPDEFYTRLKTAKVMPTTSQVSVVTMREIFTNLISQDAEVLAIFISAKLSGTVQSAMQALDELGSAAERVTVVDGNACAMALGFQVLAAARALRDGATREESRALVEKSRDHVGVYFAVETLEFLHRGGRIGGAQRFIGSALNLKPVLALKDGRIEPEDRVRTKSKALDRVLELVSASVAGQSNIRLATVHANAESEARQLLERASRELGAVESILACVSPVVGVHAGPGTVGLAFMAGM